MITGLDRAHEEHKQILAAYEAKDIELTNYHIE
jgi:hypothetical protein